MMAKATGKADKRSFSKNQVESTIAVILVLVGLGWASWNLQHISCIDCVAKGCEYAEECKFFEREWILSFLLIVTHLIPFTLIPLTMCIVWNRTPFLLKITNKEMHPFILQLGLACICFASAFEFGWHVTTVWYYRNDFHVLNLFFYSFLVSSFALWANGFYSSWQVSMLFAANMILFGITYPIGATKEATAFKIPIYCALTVNFVSMTMRGRTVLDDWRMLSVPFFSVGVNLFFAFLLQSGDKGGELTKWNYIYHIAHDIFGTEMGTAFFAYLILDNPHHRNAVSQKMKHKAK
jgi:hypothetical protein